jgi:hypothetical protein
MRRSPPPFPSPAEGWAYHLRLLDADPVAPAELCNAYLQPLLAWLGRLYPRVDGHLVEEGVYRALVSYAQRPEGYDGRIDLAAYLRMAARCDLFNLLREEGRHHRRRVPWKVVELDGQGGNFQGREEEPADRFEREEEDAAWQEFLRSVQEDWTATERRTLELMRAGERSTAVFATALGCDGLPPAEQEREVKRVKDRILARLKREVRKHG